MNITLRNLALGVAMTAAGAMFAQSAPVTLFEDDFEWLEPWSSWHEINKPSSGDAVGTDNPSTQANQLAAAYIGSVSEGTAVTAYDALVDKGYGFVVEHAASKDARKPQNQIYLQKNYLKFGLTGYYSGITLPAFNQTVTETVTLDFDWCSQRQGSGKWDPTKLVVVVNNNGAEQQFLVPEHNYVDNEAFAWIHASLPLEGATITEGTTITIRNIDEQWPVQDSAPALRFYLDNLKVSYVPEVKTTRTIYKQDFEFLGEVHPEAKNAMNSCPDETFDEVGLNLPGKKSAWSSSQYFGAYGSHTTAYDYMVAHGMEVFYVKAEGKKDRNGAASTAYVMKNYLKFGLTGYQAGISFTMPRGIEAGTASVEFDWCPQGGGADAKAYDAVELVVIVKNGADEKQFAVPAPGLEWEATKAMEWIHANIALPGATINKGTQILVRHADSQWPDARALRWYFDNFEVKGAPAPVAVVTESKLTEVWKTHEGFTADVRGGNGLNGKVYVVNGKEINTIENGKVTTVYTSETAMNKGLFVDEAGNMLVNYNWPTSANNWFKFRLISADGQTVKDLEIKAPTESTWPGDRADLNHRAIGDFFSEEGGLCYLTANTLTAPIPVYIAGGEVVELEYGTDAVFGAANTTAYAIPSIESMNDFDFDEVRNTFYYYTGSNAWQVGYVNEEGEAAYLPTPKAITEEADGKTKVIGYEGLPAGWLHQTQNGFDVVTLGGKKYIFRMVGAGTWCPDFLIQDEEGNVVAHTNYNMEEGWGSIGKAGLGCGIFVRKVSETKAEIYQVFKSGALENSFAAMYTFEVPAAPLYIAGQFQNWDPANPAQFGFDGDNYIFDLKQDNGGFKISTAKGSWDEFNAGVLGVNAAVLAPGKTYALVAGKSDDLQIGAGDYTFTVNLDEMTLSVEGEEHFIAPTLYLRGDFNGWGTEGGKFESDLTVNEEGNVVYTYTAAGLEGQLKIADDSWGTNFGGVTIEGPGKYTLVRNGENMNMAKIDNVELTFILPSNAATEPTLIVKGTQYVERKAYAYDLNATAGDNANYTVTYKATAAAKSATLSLVPETGDAIIIDLPAPAAGENEATVSLADVPAGNYNWQINLVSELAGDKAGIAYKAPEEWVDGDNAITGGVVWIRDAQSDAYGYTVVGMGKAHGYAVYNPAGELLTETPAHKGFSKLTAGNGSSTTRGDALGGYAVFADWSDGASGAWLVDPLNIAAEPRNIFMVEGATQAANGTVTYNGVQTGSGTSTVAFQGTGADTKMFTFDEDIYGNTLVRYDLGDATTVVAAPTLVMEAYKGKMANTNIEVEAVANGFFVSQNRANSDDAGVPGLMFFDNDGELVWDSGNKNILNAEDPTTTGISSGVAVSRDGSRLALSGYNKIYVFDLEFNADDEPVLSNMLEIPMTSNYSANRHWMQLTFDAADNLHVYNRMADGYHVIVLPGETEATTPAKAENIIAVATGLEGINAADNAPVEYFNLQGIRVNAENMTPGVYVRRQGNTATKVYVK